MQTETDTSQANRDEELRVYLIVNTDLNMGIGKTAGQVGHAVQYLTDKRQELIALCDIGWYHDIQDAHKKTITQTLLFNKWHNSPTHSKIVLAADTKEFNSLKETYADRCVVVRDAGRTEIPNGSETVIGLYPMRKDERCALLKRLRLL